MSISGGIKIHVLHCGCVSLPRRAAFGGPALPARRVDLPVSAYLIEHPQGLILVDTGWSREISPRGVYEPEAVRRVLFFQCGKRKMYRSNCRWVIIAPVFLRH